MASNRKSLRPKDIMFPNRILSNLIDDYIKGKLTDYQIFYKAVVVKIDYVGGKLSGPGTKNPDDFQNPPNSVQARILNRDKYKNDDELTVFWPMFSHDIMPIKEGEHIYVFFELANEEKNGIWMCRTPEPNKIQNSNLSLGSKKYKTSGNSLTVEQETVNTAGPVKSPKLSESFIKEEVPVVQAQTGDRVIEGSNNTIIVFSTDEKKSDAGSISIATGRETKEVSLDNVKTIIHLTSNKDGSITIKAKGKVIVEAEEVQLGDGATEKVILGDQLKTFLETPGSISTPAGPGKVALIPSSCFSQKVKVK